LALLLRGTFYSLLGEHKKALEDYSKLIDEADTKVRINALVKRGIMKVEFGTPEESLNDLALAAVLGPDNADVFHHRGQVNIL
jgi:mitochondrial import receptor subunit TOM70